MDGQEENTGYYVLKQEQPCYNGRGIADTFAVDCQIALGAQTKDYEDAVMIETAKRIGADCIITRNLKDYTATGIPVYSPANFLSKLSENE